MHRLIKPLLLSTAFILSSQAQALSITDVNLGDNFTIDSVDQSLAPEVTINETYGVGIPVLISTLGITSPDPRTTAGITSSSSTPSTGNFLFFDKNLTFTAADLAIAETWQFTFNVANFSTNRWIDYHFDFFDATFSSALTSPPLNIVDAFSPDFAQDVLNGNSLSFFDGIVHKGETATFVIEIDLKALDDAGINSIGIRQYATIPNPMTLSIFLPALMWLRRR